MKFLVYSMESEKPKDRRDPSKNRVQDENSEIYAMIRRSKSLIERVDELLGRKKDDEPPPEMAR